MKIVGFTMLTDPDYRQDPWRECIRQALEVFDEVVVMCGRKEDILLIDAEFPNVSRVYIIYLDWPQPEWSYEELPRHLNPGLKKAKELGADWAVKFDTDYFFHEKYKEQMETALSVNMGQGKLICSFEKMQLFLADRGYEKGQLYIAINCRDGKDIVYGQDKTRYTDLCQPIIWDGKETVTMPGGTYKIPVGDPIPDNKTAKTGCIVFNYDYTFKTYERAKTLLYHFDRSHARWWKHGYSGKELDAITPESAMVDYLAIAEGRIKKCYKKFSAADHPKHIQERIKNIKTEEFGYNLWDKVPYQK